MATGEGLERANSLMAYQQKASRKYFLELCFVWSVNGLKWKAL